MKGEDADNPLVKEARPDTEAVLDDLLAGRTHGDSGLARLARKVAGYTSWTIEGQEVEPNVRKSVKFDGTLKGPSGEAGFTVLMVKQRDGRWMIGTFSGPNPMMRPRQLVGSVCLSPSRRPARPRGNTTVGPLPEVIDRSAVRLA